MFTPGENPLLNDLLDFGHGSLVGATFRQLSADYAELGRQGSGNLGTLDNFAQDVTSDLLGLAAGAVSPTSYKEGVAHIQDRASDVMARELATGDNVAETFANGLWFEAKDVTGINGVKEGLTGRDQATLEKLSGMERVRRGGFGLFQFGTLGAGTAPAMQAKLVGTVNRLRTGALDLRAAAAKARVAEAETTVTEAGVQGLTTPPGECNLAAEATVTRNAARFEIQTQGGMLTRDGRVLENGTIRSRTDFVDQTTVRRVDFDHAHGDLGAPHVVDMHANPNNPLQINAGKPRVPEPGEYLSPVLSDPRIQGGVFRP